MDTEWVSAKCGAQMLGIHWSHFPHVASAAGIRRRLLPGMKCVRYHKPDIERTARESILPAAGPAQAEVTVDSPAEPAKRRRRAR